MSALDRNPFHILGLARGCTAMDIARARQKLTAMLAVQFEGAAVYTSPLGVRSRDTDLVRWAALELAEPDKYSLHEATAIDLAPEEPPADRLAPWPDALAAFGWGRG